MLKQKIDTAALFAQKKTEVQSSARTLLTLDGQENTSFQPMNLPKSF